MMTLTIFGLAVLVILALVGLATIISFVSIKCGTWDSEEHQN